MNSPSLALIVVLLTGFTTADAGTWGLSMFGGLPVPHAKYAVSSNEVEFVDTDFDEVSTLLGGKLTLMFRNPAFVGADLSARRYRMDLDQKIEGGRECLGTLEMTPILLGLTFRKVRHDPGFAAHGGLSLGISLNSFEKTAHLDSLEAEPNSPLDVDVSTSFAMDFDFGIDYFVTQFLAVSADVRWEVSPVPVDGWFGYDHMYIQSSNFQFVLGANWWVRL